MPEPPATTRPQRSDAVRNRAALVKVAADAFQAEGLAVSVNEIARRAGVNVATLYRHFATKDDLVDAVFLTLLDPVLEARDRTLTANDGDVLERFVREAAELQAANRGLVEALMTPTPDPAVRARLRGPSREIVEPIVERAHASGTLRADFDAEDLLIVLRMISVVAGSAAGTGKPLDRYVDFALRGLR